MAKTVEISFAIGAALTGGFSQAFSKAGQAMSQLQQRSSSLQKASGQVESYQKLQNSISQNQAAMISAREQAKALETQMYSSAVRSAELQNQYRGSQATVENLSATLGRNKEAYKAAQSNVQTLESQIKSSKAPTAELQKQYARAQEYARRLGEAVKKGAVELKQAQGDTKRLKSEMQASATQTKAMSTQWDKLNSQADKLQNGLTRDSEALAKMRAELSAAGVDTNNLAVSQQKLAEQSQKVSAAQEKLAKSRAAFAATKEQLSFSNIKGDLITAAGAGMSLMAPMMKAADFEQQMARINAVAFSGAGRDKDQDAKEFEALRKQALQLGADTQFTAVQAAQSQENLARAGFKTNEIISAMPGLLDMAAAEGMDLATGADIMASALRGFGLEADNANRISNILAQTSAASNSSIAGLGESLKYVAPLASGLGISIEETNAMLGKMADAGIKGSQGGTALRAALTRLSKEPAAVAKEFKKLGISARDSQGNLREMPDLMQALNAKIGNKGSADQMKILSNIFGGEAASGMLAIMKSSVDGSLQELTRLNRESSGQLQALAKHAAIPIEDLRAGMENSDKIARKLGISFSDLSIYTTMLANSGIKGAAADKAMSQAFEKISKQPKQVEKALKSYGVALVDSKGQMRDFPAIIDDLNISMKDMKPPDQLAALTKIFGKEGAKAIQTFMKESAAGTYDTYNEVAKKATGVSQEMAEKIRATLKGQMTIAGSAVEGFMLEIGNVLIPYATQIVKAFSTITSGLTKLMKDHPEWTKWIVSAVAGFAALKVAITGARIGGLLMKLPFQGVSVVLNTLNTNALASAKGLTEAGKSAGLFSKLSGKLTSGVKGIGGAFKSVGSGISKAFSGIMSMGKSLITGLFSPLGLKIMLIGGAIAALAAGAYLIYKNWDKIKAWWDSWTFKDVFAVIKGYATRAFDYVKEAWTAVKERVANGWDNLKNKFAERFPVTFDFLGKAATNLSSMFEGLGETVHGIFTLDVYEIGEGLINTFDSAYGVITSGADFVAKTWSKTKDSIAIGWSDLRSAFGERFSFGFDGIEKIATNVASTFDGLGETFHGLLTLNFSEVGNGLVNTFDSAYDTISTGADLIAQTWNKAKDGIALGWNDLKNSLSERFPFGFETLETIGINISSMFDNLGKTIHGIFTLDLNEFGTGLVSAFDSASNAIGAGADFISQKWGDVKNTVTTHWEDFRSQFGDSLKNTFDGMEKLATGASGIFEGAGQTIKSLLTFDFTGAFDGLLQAFSGVCDTIKGTWDTVTGGIADAWNGAVDWTANLFGFGPSEEELAANEQTANQAQLQAQVRDMTVLNKMSEGFAERVAEMSAAYEPFKASLGEGFEAIYNTMTAVAENIRGVVIPAITELTTSLSRVGTEIRAIAQAANLSVNVNGGATIGGASTTSGGRNKGGGWWAHAEGGIFSRPHFGVVAEAGREAVIPLEDFSRGSALWLQAGQELGLLDPLGSESEHVPLWKAASDDSELLASSMITNNNNTNTSTSDNHATISPVFNITFSGNSQPDDRQNIMQMFRECWEEFQAQEMRLSFA